MSPTRRFSFLCPLLLVMLAALPLPGQAAPPLSDLAPGAALSGPLLDSASSPPASAAQTIYGNGPLVNRPGGGYGGADASMTLDLSLGLTSRGFLCGSPWSAWLADDFIVSGDGWDIDAITLYAYVRGAGGPSINTARIAIYDGPPNDPGSSLILGDLSANLSASSAWAGFYRTRESDPNDVSRAVQEVRVTLNTTWSLNPGSYWLVFGLDAPTGDPYTPPLTTGRAVTGDALQHDSLGPGWIAARDAGTGTAQGLPFQFHGTWRGSQAIPALNGWGLVALGGLLALILVRGRKPA